ncbi:MAG: hypothetical protein PHW53_00885 [Patescibacteria group bacterium]|nr:hypothetical protein [Patescibacteria group bacterium]
MKFFGYETSRPRPEQPLPEEIMREAKSVVQAEEFESTAGGDTAREHLNKLPENAPRRQAVEALAYMVLPEFFDKHPKFEWRPVPGVTREEQIETLKLNQDFVQALMGLEASYGAHGARATLSNQDVESAWDLAQEYLDNQYAKNSETGGGVMAA